MTKLFASVVRRLSHHNNKKRTKSSSSSCTDGDKSVSTTANTSAASQSIDSAGASSAQFFQEDEHDGGDSSSFYLVQSSLPYSPQGAMIRADHQYDLSMCEDDDETYVSGMGDDYDDNYNDDSSSDCSSLHSQDDHRNKLQSTVTTATSQTSRSCVRLDISTPKQHGRSVQMYRLDMDGSIKAIL